MRAAADNADTNLIIDAPEEIADCDERAAAWADDRPLFVRRAPLTRAQFEAARHAGAVPIRIYRRGYAQYIVDYEACQKSAKAQLKARRARFCRRRRDESAPQKKAAAGR